MGQVTDMATTITSVTATPMPTAESSRFETPRNGHMPKNFTSTRLSERIMPKRIAA